jgi:RHS repeat-associated protein
VEVGNSPTWNGTQMINNYTASPVWTNDLSEYRPWYGPGFVFVYRIEAGVSTCMDNSGNWIPAQTYSYVVFIEPDGSAHKLLAGGHADQNWCGSTPPNTGRGPLFVAQDESNIRFLSTAQLHDWSNGWFVAGYSPLEANGVLYFPDGRQYTISAGVVTTITDRNGNTTTLTYASNANGPGHAAITDRNARFPFYVTSVIDPTGRQYSISYDERVDTNCDGSSTVCDKITYPAQDNTTQNIVVRYKALPNALRPDLSAPPGGLFPNLRQCNNVNCVLSATYMLSGVDLPNATSWGFQYTPYGEIARVVMPTGGAVEYDHGAAFLPTTGIYSSGQVLDNLNFDTCGPYGTSPSWGPFIYRRLLTRREYADSTASSLQSTTTYSTSESPVPSSSHCAATSMGKGEPAATDTLTFSGTAPVRVTVQHQNNSAGSLAQYSETHQFHERAYYRSGSLAVGDTSYGVGAGASLYGASQGLTSAFTASPDHFEGMEYHTEVAPGSGGPTRIIDRVYGIQGDGAAARVCQENATYADPLTGNGQQGQSSITSSKLFFYDTAYDGSMPAAALQFGNLTDEYDYDFGPSTTSALGAAPVAASPAVPVQTSSFNQAPVLQCYAAAPTGWVRKAHTDYVNGSAYVTPALPLPSPFLPSLRSESRVFDGSGKLTDEVVSYDGQGSQDPGGTYSGVAGATACDGGAALLTRGNVAAITSGVGTTATHTLTYDCVGNVRSHKDPNGNTTTYRYDDNWWPSAQGVVTTYAYLTSIQLPNSATDAWQYDYSLGMMRQETAKNDATDSSDNLVTTFDYGDPLNRLKGRVRGSGASDPSILANMNVSYNDTGAPVSVAISKDQYGTSQQLVTQTNYDGLGRPTASVLGAAVPITTSTTYDGFGRVYQRTNPAVSQQNLTDGSATFSYDENGRLLSVAEPDGSQVSYYYSIGTTAAGGNVRMTAVTDEMGYTRTLQYDALERMVSVVEPSPGTTTRYEYTALGELLYVRNGINLDRQFTYDGLRRLQTAFNPENGTVTYSHDSNGNTISRSDGRGISCYGLLGAGGVCDGSGYDALNRPTHITYAVSQGGSYSTDPDTQEAWYCYDGATYSGQTNDCNGPATPGQMLRRTGSGNATSFTNYVYDVAGRLTSAGQTTGSISPYVFSYAYYNDDSRASVEYPSGRTVSTCYDSNGRALWLSASYGANDCTSGTKVSPSAAYVSGVNYTPPGGMQQMTLGNGLVESDSWNSRLQMTSVGVGALLQLNIYPCDQGATTCTKNNGNIWRETLWIGGQVQAAQEFRYDALNRLRVASEQPTPGFSPDCAASPGTWCQQMAVDPVGNATIATYEPTLDSSLSAPLSIDTSTNRILNSTGSSWGYDASGNLTSNGVGETFYYDANGRQVAYCGQGLVGCSDKPKTGATLYRYDAEGQRVIVDNNGSQTIFAYADGELAAEYSSASQASSGTQYITTDHLGSTRLVTDANGAVLERHDYFPYGGEINQSGTWRTLGLGYFGAGDLRLKFSGKERDAETGLDYFGARYYSGVQGRWTSPDKPFADQDSEDPQSWNLYGYVRNNPLRLVDDTGEGAKEGILQGLKNLFNHTGEGFVSLVLEPEVAIPNAVRGLAKTAYLLGTRQGNIELACDIALMSGDERIAAATELGGGLLISAAVGGAVGGGESLTELGISEGEQAGTRTIMGTVVRRGGETADTISGRQAHADFAAKVKQKPGWQSEPSLIDPATGKTVKPDAVSRAGRPVELKPRTPSGRAAGRSQLPKYERATGKSGRVVYYNKKDPNAQH